MTDQTGNTGNTGNTDDPRPETRDAAVYRIVRDLVEKGEDLTVREPRGPDVEVLNLYLELAAEAQADEWAPAMAKERDDVTLAVRTALEAAAKADPEPEDDEQQKPAELARETPPEPPPPPQATPKAPARAARGAATGKERDQAPEPSAYPTMLYGADGQRSIVSDNAGYQRARAGGFRLLDEYAPEQRGAIIRAGGSA
jgi:hypothetical protein